MLTERDKEIVDWIGRIGAAGAEHVMRRFGMGRSTAYLRLNRLVADRLLEQRSVLYRQAGLYVATMPGLRWCGLGRLGVHRVGAMGFVHAREVATAAVELHLAGSGWRVIAERELRALETDKGELLGSARVGQLPDGRPALHRPDLLLIAPGGRAVAIEVELSTKARRRLLSICRGWTRARHVDAVYYLAAPSVARAVERAVGELRAADRIMVLPLNGAAQLTSLEREEVSDGTDPAALAARW